MPLVSTLEMLRDGFGENPMFWCLVMEKNRSSETSNEHFNPLVWCTFSVLNQSYQVILVYQSYRLRPLLLYLLYLGGAGDALGGPVCRKGL